MSETLKGGPFEPIDTNKNLTPIKSSLEKDTTVRRDITKSSNTSDDGEPDLAPHLHARTFLAVFAVCLIYVAQVFALVGAGAQGQFIASQFNSPEDSIWITAPLTILTVVLGPIVSQASDYWGRRWFLIIPSLFGAVGCIVVARASSMGMVIAGFTILGIAFGAQPLLHTVASEVLTRRWRSWAQACIMISNALGIIAGLLVGGALNRDGNPGGFRNHFYIAMAIFALASLIYLFAYRPLPTKLQTTYSFREKIAQLDWIGYGLLASSLVSFCLGLSWSHNPYEWSDPHVSATFAIGVALAFGLILYETKFKKDGMFHHGLFKGNRNFTIALICVSVLYETDFLIVGVRFSIAFIALIAASLFTGLYCAVAKKLSTPPELISVASGLLISVRSLGGTIGIAIYNAVFISATNDILQNIGKAGTAAGLPSSSIEQFVTDIVGQNKTGFATIPGITPEIISAGVDALLDAYTTGFRNVWVSAIGFIVLAAIASLFLFDPSKEFNNHIDAPVEKEEDMYSS
ncbi:hypothetical protein G7Y89_g11820 [Cudoniella acicularis]|uniref:Major facilitator superfamily (MFS) profile domain-containing protein n=1 Tax=Cudoniella acicularis TaxID=354080 RepID=A0A8H4VZT7_9HELO|nr:hypothetical protein G7Y89_g11820 [Cudoniella acicularis]